MGVNRIIRYYYIYIYIYKTIYGPLSSTTLRRGWDEAFRPLRDVSALAVVLFILRLDEGHGSRMTKSMEIQGES